MISVAKSSSQQSCHTPRSRKAQQSKPLSSAVRLPPAQNGTTSVPSTLYKWTPPSPPRFAAYLPAPNSPTANPARIARKNHALNDMIASMRRYSTPVCSANSPARGKSIEGMKEGAVVRCGFSRDEVDEEERRRAIEEDQRRWYEVARAERRREDRARRNRPIQAPIVVPTVEGVQNSIQRVAVPGLVRD